MTFLHPWYYPYITVMAIAGLLMLILIPRAALGLLRDIADRRERKEAAREHAAFKAQAEQFLAQAADAGPIDGTGRWPL